MVNRLRCRVARCSRSWKGVHDRGKWGVWLEIDRKRTAYPGGFAPRSVVDAEREDLHVEVEAADRAAIEQFKRAGAGARPRTVGRRGLEVLAGDTGLWDRGPRGGNALGTRPRAVRVRAAVGGQTGSLSAAGLCLDPWRVEAPPSRDPAAAVGRIRRTAWRSGVPPQRGLPDLSALGEAAQAPDAPAALRRGENVRRLRRPHGPDLGLWRRRSLPCASVRDRDGGERLCIRRGHAHRIAARLARQPRASTGVLWRGANDHCARQPEGRRHACRSLRTGTAAVVRRDGSALSLCRHTGAAVSAEGQKPRRTDRALGVSLDPCATAAPALL